MKLRHTKMFSEDDLGVRVTLEFQTLNNCCGMGTLTNQHVQYLARGRGPTGRIEWMPAYFDINRAGPFLKPARRWFENLLTDMIVNSWPVIVIQVVDYSKRIVSDGDAGYEQCWSMYDWLRRIERSKGAEVRVDWSKAYENLNSGNYIKVAMITER